MDKDGNIKALASYPSLSPECSAGRQSRFYSKKQKLAGGKDLYLFRDSPSVPLTAYPVASTWKMILGGVAVLVKNSECNKGLSDNLVPSANPYFQELMKRMLNPENNVAFKQRLEDDFDIYFDGDQKQSGMLF